MELTINTNSLTFTDYLNLPKKLKKKNSLIMKRLRVKRSSRLLSFKKWFEKEHDYCLPIKENSPVAKKCKIIENEIECFVENGKSWDSNEISLDSSTTLTDLKKINVNNELSSCSLYAIDVTTELLKGALLENQKNQLNREHLTATSKDNINSSNSCVSTTNQSSCSNNDVFKRLENESILQTSDNKKENSLKESTPAKLFSSMDIDSDMIKLFPTLDFSTEHTLNEKLENFKSNEIDSQNIVSSENVEEDTKNQKTLSLNHSSSKSLLPLQAENIAKSHIEIDAMQPKLSNELPQSSSVNSIDTTKTHLASQQYLNIFNRYQGERKVKFIERVENPGPVLLRDLLCGSKPKTIISPYTNRHLKPYIFRDPVTKPLWLQMLNELKEHFRRKNKLPELIENETIDYSYVRAKHIRSVNALARQFFWPGIDLSESLMYPDFSIIALYKNLVIGFGFMVPDISTNENYITFLFTRPYWTNCGIAKFMIYHLIQTCVTRDITLHVSPNNPAMILYQKFGFKIEQFVQNFYENYIPRESELSKHALFLRLRSTLQKK